MNEAGGERRGKEEKGRHSSLEWRKVAENVRVKKQRESSLAFQRWETTLRLEGTALLSQLSKCAKVCSKEEQTSGARRRENRKAEWMGKNKEEWFGIEKARKYDRNGSLLTESLKRRFNTLPAYWIYGDSVALVWAVWPRNCVIKLEPPHIIR